MKYAKHIVFFLFINLVIVFLTIFLGNLTRKLEISNNLKDQDIQKQKEQLKINKIEYSFYNNPNYIKKLYEIYFSYEEEDLDKKIVNLSNISNLKNNKIILVNLKSQ
tara:strand:- start:264 stop:584 length:321 start_codon:yes stop_codon:yes gene_type:complete